MHDKFNIELPPNYEGELTLQIIDPSGKIYNIDKKKFKARRFVIPLDVSRFRLSPEFIF
jgi:hypothetical protein